MVWWGFVGAGWLVAMVVEWSWGWVWWWVNGWLVCRYWGGEREVCAEEVEEMMAHGGKDVHGLWCRERAG